LKRFVKNLKEMVVEINVKVVEQGETLEKVEENIDITKENVQKAEKELEIAGVVSKQTFKKKIKFYIFAIIVIGVIGLILGLTLGL